MFAKVSLKIDIFVPVIVFTAIFMAGIGIFTFKSVFEAITQANEIQQEIPDSQLRINKDLLNEAYNKVTDETVVSLEIK